MSPAPPPFTWTIFLTLAVILASSLAMFVLLVRRWTTQRQWVSLAEWAKERGFRFRPTDPAVLPKALHQLRTGGVQPRLHLCSEEVSVVQLCTDPPEGGIEPNRWNVLIQQRAAIAKEPAALRPASAPASLLDLFGLSPFPALAVAHRFSVLSTNSSAARALAESASRTLMPADIGLLLIDDSILLDFSTRPFDPIELDRMIALGKQLSQML